MDDDSLRIAVGLRLGVPICGPHLCHHCWDEVDVMGRHALSCRKSEGRHHRHAVVNDIIHRTLASAHVPSWLEPSWDNICACVLAERLMDKSNDDMSRAETAGICS